MVQGFFLRGWVVFILAALGVPKAKASNLQCTTPSFLFFLVLPRAHGSWQDLSH